MIRSIHYVVIILLCTLMVFSCAQRGDHNPLGLTGGSDGGYGKRQSYYYYGSSLQQNDNSIEGVWTDTNNTLTIKSDGTFELKSGEEIRTGTIIKVKDKLNFNFKDGSSVTYSYTIEKGRLSLTEVE